MTHRLLVIRHAKAAEGSVDLERPLAPRGVRDAGAIGDWLDDNGLVPDRVVVSPARRALETWSGAAARLHDEPDIEVDDRIYDNAVEPLLAVVHDTPEDVASLALVGHNPSFGEFVYRLDDGAGDPEARQEIAAGFPTSAVTVFEIDGAWPDVTLGGARLVGYAAPRG